MPPNASVAPEAMAPPASAAVSPTPPPPLDPFPAGWREPHDAELNGPHAAHRGDSPSAYLAAEGDFNGDGARDRALLLVSDARDQYGVFVFDGRPDAYPVLVGGPAAMVEQLAVSSAPEGRIAFFVFGSSRFEIAWDGAAYAVSTIAD
jgi:hypothetical protein